MCQAVSSQPGVPHRGAPHCFDGLSSVGRSLTTLGVLDEAQFVEGCESIGFGPPEVSMQLFDILANGDDLITELEFKTAFANLRKADGAADAGGAVSRATVGRAVRSAREIPIS